MAGEAISILDVAKDAENQWQLEAHNPTDQDKEVEISTHPAFRSFKFAGKVKIKAGDSAILQPQCGKAATKSST